MVTISDVAKMAGVSVATISRVLNNSNLVKPDTAEKVRQCISELGYIPNLSARNLRKNESGIILILAPNFTNPYYAEILSGIGDEAKEKGYSVLICKTDDDKEEEIAVLNMLHTQRADGAILLSSTDKDEWLQEYVDKYPIVQCCEYSPSLNISHVSIDNYKAAYEMVKYLIGIGHRRIGTISSKNDYISTELRYEGYRDALVDSEVPVDESLVVYSSEDYSFSSAYEAAKILLTRNDRPTAVFCISDILALGSISAAMELGLRVPQDVSITGFDDCGDYSTMVHPHLTTVAQPCYEIGRTGLSLLHKQISRTDKEDDGLKKRIFLPHKLVVRESTTERQ